MLGGGGAGFLGTGFSGLELSEPRRLVRERCFEGVSSHLCAKL